MKRLAIFVIIASVLLSCKSTQPNVASKEEIYAQFDMVRYYFPNFESGTGSPKWIKNQSIITYPNPQLSTALLHSTAHSYYESLFPEGSVDDNEKFASYIVLLYVLKSHYEVSYTFVNETTVFTKDDVSALIEWVKTIKPDYVW